MEESAKVDLSEKALRKLTAGMISNIEAAPTLDEMVRDGKTAWGMPNQNMGLILQDQPDDSTPTPKPTEKPTPTPALPAEKGCHRDHTTHCVSDACEYCYSADF